MVGTLQSRFSWQRLRSPVRSALFLGLLFLTVCLWIDPTLIYHGHGQFTMYPIHVPGMTTFLECRPFPGEALEYVVARLSHYYYYSWAGALIITTAAGLLCWGTDKFIVAVGGDAWRQLRFVPALLLLMQYGRYYHYLADSLALLFGLLLVFLYIRTPLERGVFRFLVFVVFSVVMYGAAGQAHLVFGLLCAIVEFFNRRRWVLGAACLLAVPSVPYLVGTFVFELSATEAYRHMWPIHPEAYRSGIVLVFSLLLFFPVAGCGCALGRLMAQKRAHRPGQSGQARRPQNHKSGQDGPGRTRKLLESYRRSPVKWPLETLALLLLTVGTVVLTCDQTARKRLRIEYFARHKMWDNLLREADQLPERFHDSFVCHEVNRALYHTGRLGYDMFSYPQHPSALLLIDERRGQAGGRAAAACTKLTDTFFQLGHVNRAEHFAHEALELIDYNPVCLQHLALINIVKGQTDSARTFLRALSRDFLYREWAQEYLARLETDPLLSADEEIARIRSLMIVEDYVGRSQGGDIFQRLLVRNVRNRMAFEYLMAFLLLNGYHAEVAASIKYLDNYNYPAGEIPRHYEEAILLHYHLTGRVVKLNGRRIGPLTIQRFENFVSRQKAFAHDREGIRKALAEDFGDTYYHYYLSRLAK